MSEDARHVYGYPGRDVDVTRDRRLCIHVQECTRATGEVFVRERDPWGEPDRLGAGEVAAVVERRPTGALAYVRKDGGPPESPPADNVIVVSSRGPLYAHGDLRIAGAPGDTPGARFRAALCRCGDSRNKPFCDGTHKRIGFTTEEAG